MPSIPEELHGYSPAQFVFLVGAGISRDKPTCLPTVHELVSDLVALCCGKATKKAQYLTDKIWEAVTRKHNPVGYRFELLIDSIRKNFDPLVAIGKVFSADGYNSNHYLLAEMLTKGSCVITTNFDCCIENAADSAVMHKYVFTGQGTDLPPTPAHQAALVKVHGSVEQKEELPLLITLSALASTQNGFRAHPDWKKYLSALLHNRVLIVLGYSGSDDFDVTPLLLEASPQKCLWISYSPSSGMPDEVTSRRFTGNEAITKIKNIRFYEGSLGAFAAYLLGTALPGAAVTGRASKSTKLTDYVRAFYPSPR